MLIIAALTVHNRKAKTLACLECLDGQHLPPGVTLRIVLVDDGSSDGTADAVRTAYPNVMITQGNGSLYWGGGMALATATALAYHPDAVWWLNDDVEPAKNCLVELLNAHASIGGVVVGCVYDTDGRYIYGGYHRRRGFRFVPAVPVGSDPLPIDTLNGNCVVFPRHVLEKVPPSDPAVFVHNGGDIDIGLRIRRAGYALHLIPAANCIGTVNSTKFTWNEPGLSLGERWRSLTSVLALYPPMTWALCIRHAGVLGPLYFVRPYAAMLLKHFIARLRSIVRWQAKNP